MTIDDWRARYDGLNAENDKLRVLLATSNANCAFCGLPAAEMAKCGSGFPGCSRADDMFLCEHPTRKDLLEENERLREHEARALWCDAAQAGEARAVEALRTIRGEDIYPDADGMIEDATCLYCYGNSADGCDEDCPRAIAAHVIDSAQPALGWLAQQRREAAAEALERLASMESSSSTMLPKSVSVSEDGL